MNVTTAKVVSMLALGLGSFFGGMLPSCFSESARQRHPLVLSCLLCFGGGVLLATSLVHMLPEAREKYPNYSELMVCIGFFIVYLVDEIFHLCSTEINHGSPANQGLRYGTERSSLLNRDGELRERCPGEVDNPQMCHVSHTAPCNRSSSGTIGLLCALFVHSLLEGLAIGLQEDGTQVLLLLGAVASHKFVVAFCLGAELCASLPGRMCAQMVCILIFSGGSVAGIGMGAALENVRTLKDSVAVPIMQALAAGTLLYVTVSEVLPRERANWHERKSTAGIAQFTAVAVGFAAMYLCTVFLDHDG
ncbi:zinc transporter ZIP3 [Bombyx mandarina]|uniref:Zinc/iron transporter n=2 Tax=Bombyx TaxID=7090 RepID=A0A8R2AKD4_BOMMO|nr:zinc transporter ZIP3 [Bombyx mori]XP_028026693.1 zinc transporter ZIP3 [Bombyx mandarina]